MTARKIRQEGGEDVLATVRQHPRASALPTSPPTPTPTWA